MESNKIQQASQAPLSDREQVLVDYALLLGLTGEHSPQTEQFLERHSDTCDEWSALVDITLKYRLLKQQLG